MFTRDSDTDPMPPTLRDGQPARATAPPAPVDYGPALWVPAAHWSSGRPEPVRLVVLHSTENDIKPGVARNVARWFAAGGDCRASAHYVVGPDEVWQTVREHDRSWAAGATANRLGVHVELVGRAGSTDWSSGPGLEVLRRAAPLVADICRRHGLTVQGLDVSRLEAGESGIVTHAACTACWHESTHRDPGLQDDERWPWELWLALVGAG
jgi:hypothetical protein